MFTSSTVIFVGYFMISCVWAAFAHSKLEEDPVYIKNHKKLGIMMFINFAIWPICMLVFAYARIVLKTDTLFVSKKEDD